MALLLYKALLSEVAEMYFGWFGNESKKFSDAVPGLQWDPCVVAAMDKFTQTTESCGEKGMARPLSQEESTQTLALTGFYCFSGPLTLRMILIYCAQVHFRWLQKTKERVLLITSNRKDICKCKGKSGWTGYSPSLEGIAQILGSYFKDMQ